MPIFDVLETIGYGSHGVVHKARIRDAGEVVAVKSIKLSVRPPQHVPAHIAREVSILSSIRHPHIVHLRESAVYHDHLLLVFPYYPLDLRRLLAVRRPDPLPAALTKHVLHALLSALAHLHARGVLHRDVKPANVLLSARGDAALADFGLAIRTSANGHDARARESLSTNVVTLWYRAPELLLADDAYGPGVDVWAAACVLAECLTNRPPFDGASEPDVLALIVQTLGSPTERAWPGVCAYARYTRALRGWPPPDAPLGHVLRGAHARSVDARAVDLLAQMLVLPPERRIGAADALRHPYFDDVRRGAADFDLDEYVEMDRKARSRTSVEA